MVNLDARSDLTSHHVNIDGKLRVEIRDASGEAIPGFSWEECQALKCNTASDPYGKRPVRWGEGSSLSALCGRPIQLAFVLRNCHLYSFQMA